MSTPIHRPVIINELPQWNFFIPSYQRGYRWTRTEVRQLLSDINDFESVQVRDSQEYTWYCLQPLVVKIYDKDDKIKNDLTETSEWFEVIDGQQRLTTILLVLLYLKEAFNESDQLFELRYENRKGSETYLKSAVQNITVEDTSNIDYYHISNAYLAIKEWFEESKKNPHFDRYKFVSKFRHSTKVIWYTSQGQDPITVFTRLNIGKIPLTDAELIKALFLNSSNFETKNDEEIKLRQLEIASEWDFIEFKLHQPDFWYFINEKENKVESRIELILDYVADKNVDSADHHTFLHFNALFKNKTRAQLEENWSLVKKCFQRLEEWYYDRELYHKIGFLISNGVRLKDLIPLSESVSKPAFRKQIQDKIKETIKIHPDNLEYKNTAEVRSILLLHNILTLLRDENDTARFPFHLYKIDKWDIEHINPVTEKKPNTSELALKWVENARRFIKDNQQLSTKANNYTKDDFDNFNELYLEILNHFSVNNTHLDINDISNLVLLDQGTNRGYRNAVFPVKRDTVIEKDINGTFIPVCTKNVFLKYYSREVNDMIYWSEDDRKYYERDIITLLNDYLPTSN